jgi:opacity protein-like surface antigen
VTRVPMRGEPLWLASRTVKVRAAVLALAVTAALPAGAQTVGPSQTSRFEVDAGGGWLGGASLGSSEANLRAPDAAPATFRLFSVDSRFEAAPTFHVKAGFALTRRFGVEGGLTLSHPELRASVTNDAEAAPPITIAERIDQYSVDAGVIVMISELALGSRTVPFATAGAGYLRQLHEGRTVVEQGAVFHVGGGIKHWLLARDQGFISGAGLRVDARLYLMSGGVAFEDRRRPHGAISGGVFVAF